MRPHRARELLRRVEQMHHDERDELFKLHAEIANAQVKAMGQVMKAIDNLARALAS